MESNQLLTINSGSSSIKFALFERNELLTKILNGQIENIKTAPTLKINDSNGNIVNEKAFDKNLDYHAFYEMLVANFESNKYNVTCVGHRVVHGGIKYHAPERITSALINELKKLIPFAPLHQPYNIEAIETIAKLYPAMAQVACFDTAFHGTHPAVADRFGIPKELSAEGVRRYGFHGLSYEYILQKLVAMNPDNRNKRIVIAHLGNGASMCAIKNGKSIESTMGFTAMDGLVMGTRCGSIDPGVVLYLLDYKKMSSKEIESMLYKQSGLLGVSGITNDMKKLIADQNESAKEAVELFVYRIRRELGALTSILNGLDILVFTGGIGEHAWQIREAVCQDMDWVGLRMDNASNKQNKLTISAPTSKVNVLVIPTDEEWVIANHTYNLLKGV